MAEMIYADDGSSVTIHHYYEPNGKETHPYQGRTKMFGSSYFVGKLKHEKARDTLEILSTFNNNYILNVHHVITFDYTYLFYQNVSHTLLCDADCLFEKSENGSYQFSNGGKVFFWDFGEALELLSDRKMKWNRQNILVQVDRNGFWHPILGDSVSTSEYYERDENWKKAGSLIRGLFDDSYIGEHLHPEVEDLIQKLERGQIERERVLKRHPALWSTLMFTHFVTNAHKGISNLPAGSSANVYVTLSPSLDDQLYQGRLHIRHLVNVKNFLSELRNKFAHHYKSNYENSSLDGVGISQIDLNLTFRNSDATYMIKTSEKVAEVENIYLERAKKAKENNNPYKHIKAEIKNVSDSYPKNWYI